MTHLDDSYLIDELRAGIDGRMADVSTPDGLADDARRLARRRTRTRALGAGAPVIAAAGVATVLIAGSGGSSPQAGTAQPGGPAVSVVGVHAQDTAYVVKRVRAKLAAAAADQGGEVAELIYPTYRYTAAHVRVANSTRMVSWSWTDPQTGTQYVHDITSAPGEPTQNWNDVIPSSSQPQQQTTVTPGSTPAEIDQALSSGTVQQTATTTVNGSSAIVLSVSGTQGLTLCVDAHTYQVLRAVWAATNTTGSYNGPLTVNILPATSANRALAQGDTAPQNG